MDENTNFIGLKRKKRGLAYLTRLALKARRTSLSFKASRPLATEKFVRKIIWLVCCGFKP
jgi:hypothetical protein